MLCQEGIDDRMVHYYARIVNWLKRAGPIVPVYQSRAGNSWPHRLAA